MQQAEEASQRTPSQQVTTMRALSHYWWLGTLVAAFGLLAVGCTASSGGEKAPVNLSSEDCYAIQSLVNGMAGSDEESIDRAIAVKFLGEDPTKFPGQLASDGGVALSDCRIVIAR